MAQQRPKSEHDRDGDLRPGDYKAVHRITSTSGATLARPGSRCGRAIHSSRARLRLTHLCRADQRSQCFTVVFFGPDDAVLTQC